MARVLSISSQVAYGHVGNSVTAYVLQRLGHEVWSVPAIILSNRPGYEAIAGTRIQPEVIDQILEAGLRNGWLCGIDAITTGYLPGEAHVALCARWVERLKGERPELTYLCDPVVGDEPGGIYIDADAAAAVRDQLLRLADIATPNRFELGWLTQRAVETVEDAVAAAKQLGPQIVLATSSPGAEPGQLANLALDAGEIYATHVARRVVLAHGTGDFIAAAFLARFLNGQPVPDALAFATAAVEMAITASDGAYELSLIPSQSRWSEASPAQAHRLQHLETAGPP